MDILKGAKCKEAAAIRNVLLQSRRLAIMPWGDMADIDKNPLRNCLSLSTGIKPSGGCFSDEKYSVQTGRLVMMRWEDMADQNAFLPKFGLSFSTGMKPSGGCFRAPVLKDRGNFGGKGF